MDGEQPHCPGDTSWPREPRLHKEGVFLEEEQLEQRPWDMFRGTTQGTVHGQSMIKVRPAMQAP